MANLYFRNTGNVNYNVTTNWSATDGGGSVGAIPTSADTVYLTSNSGPCTVNVASVSNSFICTAYTNTLTFTSSVSMFGSTIILSSGMTINGTGGLSVQSSCTITSNGKTIPTLVFLGTSLFFGFTDTCTVTNLQMGTLVGALYTGGTINVRGNLNMSSQNTAGSTTPINMIGTGTWNGNATINNPLTINTTGTTTIGTVSYANGTLTYTAGNVVTTGSTLYVGANCILNTNGIFWNSINTSGAITLTLTSPLNANTITPNNTSQVFAGTAGWTTGTLNMNNQVGQSISLTTGNTYTITNSITSTGSTSASHNTIKSATPGAKATLILQQGATCDIGFVNATDIDSSLGRTFWSYKGVLSNTNNWNLLNTNNTTFSTLF